MKDLGVSHHCAKAEFLTILGPRAMGPSPPVAQGLIMFYITYGRAGGGPKITQEMKKMTKVLRPMNFGMVKGT